MKNKQTNILQFFKQKANKDELTVKIKCTACGILIFKENFESHEKSCCNKRNPRNKSLGLSLSNKKNSRGKKTKIELIEISDSDDDYGKSSTNSSSSHLVDHDSSNHSDGFINKPFYSSLCEDWKTPECSPIKDRIGKLLTPVTPQDKKHGVPCSSNGSKYRKAKSEQKKMVTSVRSKLNRKCSTSADNIHLQVSDSEDEFLPIPKLRTPSPVKSHNLKRNQKSLMSSCSSNGSQLSFRLSPKLVTPERTPTPSPYSMSNSISHSPEKFGVKNIFEGRHEEKELFPSSQPTSSQKKRTPRSTFKALQSSSPFHNSRLPSSAFGNSQAGVRNLTDAFNLEENFNHPIKDAKKLLKMTQALQYRGINGMYLDNFMLILNSVLSQPMDARLLDSNDKNVIEDFKALSLQAKKLYIRLFQRKLKWNRVSKLEYNDICDKEDIYLYINELTYSLFLLSEDELSCFEEALHLLSADEVKMLCKDLKLPLTGKKENLIKNILENQRKQKTIWSSFGKDKNNNTFLLKKIKKPLSRCCLVNKVRRDVFKRILTLFSLPHYDEDLDSGQQSQLSVLLMVSLGKVKFPDVKVLRTNSPFQNRDDLIRFDEFHQLENEIRDLSDNKKWEEVIERCEHARDSLKLLQTDSEILKYDSNLPSFLRKFTSISILLHTLCYMFEAYQHLKDYREAVVLLQELLDQETHLLDYRGRWYDRIALNWDQHLKNPKKALNIIKKALNDPNVRVGHRLALSHRASRIITSKRGACFSKEFEGKLSLMEYAEAPTVSIQGRSFTSDSSGYKRVYISCQDEGTSSQEQREVICSVEELCISHYKKEGYTQGLHSEGKAIAVLFGVLFWDIIYAEVADAFCTNYQGAPLDLDSDEFYNNRKSLLDKRFSELETKSLEEIKEIVQKVWTENESRICIFDWTLFRDVDHLQGLIESFGMRLVCAICRRLALEHRFTRSGFPDLVVWNPSTKESRIVEVKGPNDKLSTKQMLWLDYLIKNGAVAEVCHVEALGSRKRYKLQSGFATEAPDSKSPDTKNKPINKRSKASSTEKSEPEDEDFLASENFRQPSPQKRQPKRKASAAQPSVKNIKRNKNK